MYRTKTHLVSPDQTSRWLGGVYHDSERHVRSRCGQWFARSLQDQLLQVTNNLELADCKRCLHSYGREIFGPPPTSRRRQRSMREQLIEAVIHRLSIGVPLSEYDIKALALTGRVLGIEKRILQLLE